MSTSPTDPNRPPIAPSQQPDGIAPTHDQAVVLYVMVVYAVVIFGVWNIPGARNVINPLKLFTIGLHELCHIIAAILTGGTILSVTIDPNIGGATRVQGGYPPIILFAGYFGSTMCGAALTLGGWDTLVAKVESFVVGIGLLVPLALVRDKLTILLTIFYEALLIGFWFIDHGSALRWYVLFVGMMSILYVVWDIADDKFFRKANDSDATQYQIMFPSVKAQVWAVLWVIFEVGVLVGFAFLGIRAFHRDTDQMYAEAAKFLPT